MPAVTDVNEPAASEMSDRPQTWPRRMREACNSRVATGRMGGPRRSVTSAFVVAPAI
jgi:hypothetical protein